MSFEQPDRPAGRSRGAFGSFWRGAKSTIRAPFSTFPKDQIVANARLIGALARQIRREGPIEPRVFKHEDGSIDLDATSLTYGLSVDRLQLRIAARRRQTARAAYMALALGCLFVALWVYRAFAWSIEGPRMVAVVQFLPFVAIFFLVAFKFAHANWQLRTGVLGSASDYLKSSESFWPS